MPDERVLFEERHVKVTSTRVIVGPATYPVNGITSVRRSQQSPSIFPAVGGILLGMVLGVGAMLGVGSMTPGDANPIGGLVGGLVLVVCVAVGITITVRSPSTYVLTIGTAGGDRRALASRDKELVEGAHRAIEQAIADRG